MVTDMLGTPLEVGQYIAYASTRMHNGMVILKLSRVNDNGSGQALCIDGTCGWRNSKHAIYKLVPSRGIVLKDYKEIQ